jgi:hypothetical protein
MCWTEDNISVYQSDNVTVRRGVIDGNNSPAGDGVMLESGGSTDPGKRITSGTIEDVRNRILHPPPPRARAQLPQSPSL